MAKRPSERADLINHITERWPRMSTSEAEERCHEALKRALETTKTLRGPDLVERAKQELSEMALDAFWQKKRLPSSSFEALDNELDIIDEPPRPGRHRDGARTPKGTLPVHGSKPGFQMIETGTGTRPNDETRLAAHLLRTGVLEHVEANAPMSRQVGEKLLTLHREVFGHGPFDAWASVLIEQIAGAKLASIAPRERARSQSEPRSKTTLKYTLRSDPAKRTREVPLRTEPVSQLGRLAFIACYGDFGAGQGEQYVGTVTALLDPQDIEYPNAHPERGAAILNLTDQALAGLPVPCPIPGYARDAELVAWLERRLGFQGGGGCHSVTKQTLLQLLLEPEQLATSIDRHRERVTRKSRQTEPAERLNDAMRALAARVRNRAQADKSYEHPNSA